MKKRKNLGIIIHILNILKNETDSEHLITQKQIAKNLRQYGVNVRRYSIERHLETLKDMGYNIVTIKGVGTYLKNDGISADDVFVLTEALKKSNFLLEQEYVQSICNKLKSLLNKHEIEELKNKNMIL